MLKRNRGFTLLELMIVVVIVAILAAVALPSYNDYVLRGYITQATNTLSADRIAMEQFYQDNRAYTTTGAFTTPCGGGGQNDVTTAILNAFTITCVITTPAGQPANSGYTITATGGKIKSTTNFVYTIAQDGSQVTTNLGGTWAPVPAPNTCWVIKKGQTCT